MSIIEWAQWFVIGATILLVLGLYRQVGEVLVGSKDLVMHQFGPLVGQQISDRWQWLVVDDWADKGGKTAALFVSETCAICHDVLDDLEQIIKNRPSRHRSAVTLVCDGSEIYADALSARFEGMTVEQVARIEPSGSRPAGYPLALLMAADGTVIKKDLGGSVLSLAVEAIDGALAVVAPHGHSLEV